MEDLTPHTAYLRRFRRVLVHIERHLDAPLSVEALSEVARSSAHHFHRQFTSLVGLPVSKYVQLRRLHTAVWQLVFRPAVSVLAMSARAGYESPEAFTRAFKRALGVSPSEFRRRPQWPQWEGIYAPIRNRRMLIMNSQFNPPPVTIVDFPQTRLAVLEHRGSHDALHQTIQKFIDYRRRHRLSPERHATYNLVFANPQTCEPEDFRMDICCAVTRPVEPNPEGVVEKYIPAGECARIRCEGGDDVLEACLMHLYGEWLPQSGRDVRDFPLFFHRVSFFPDVPEHAAITDVYLPLSETLAPSGATATR